MGNKLINAADILLPPYAPEDEKWTSYGVIACDQYTSEPEYWEKAKEISKDTLSCLDLILPEAYLGTPLEVAQKAAVAENMKSICEKLTVHKNCLVYIERTLPSGAVRPGLGGKIDLEGYDFSPESCSPVRATEQTVVERIPPRVAVRKEATVELPHVMVFADDRKGQLIKPLSEKKDRMVPLYSFELMLGGGSISGYKIEGDLLCETLTSIESYENSAENGLVYAMGDGNHSLATAKAHFEQLKSELGDAAMEHPARYALVEVVDLYNSAIVFEPIYRIVTGTAPEKLISYIDSRLGCAEKCQCVTVVTAEKQWEMKIPALHSLTVGSLQMLIDDFLREEKGSECDYIHGVDSLEKIVKDKECIGFIFDGVEKEDLFDYVAKNGTLPRKTFSMGTAAEKRYYIEARAII